MLIWIRARIGGSGRGRRDRGWRSRSGSTGGSSEFKTTRFVSTPLLAPGFCGGVGVDLFGLFGLLTNVRLLSWMFWMQIAANVKRECLSVEPGIGTAAVDC